MSIGLIKQSQASVPTPPTGEENLFIDSADDKLKKKDSFNVVTDLEAAAAGVSSFEGRTGAVSAQSGDYQASEITNTPAGNIVGTTVQAAINELDTEKAPVTHVGAGGVTEHPIANGSVAGFMSPSDKTKIDGVASGATANDTDANLKNRANHTGTQTASTISDFNSAADSRVTAGISAHTSDSDPHPGYALDSDVTAAQAYSIQRSNHTGTQSAGTITGLATVATTGSYSDLTGTPSALPPSGAAGGDLTGSYPNPTLSAAKDANVKDRSNHTGTQTASTISDFNAAADTRVSLGIATHSGLSDPHPGYALDADVTAAQAYAIQRSNHTGTQAASTISDFDEAAQDAVGNSLTDSATIDFTYNDGANTITADVVNSSITDSKLGTGINANKISSGVVSNAEFDYLDGVTSPIQTQISAKVAKSGDSMTGGLSLTDTVGNAFVEYAPQNPTPATPSAGYRQYSGSTGRIAFKGSAGIPWSIDYLGITATRVYTLPDQSMTFMADPMTTNGDIISRQGGIASRLAIGSAGQVLKSVSGLPAWADDNIGSFFGNGQDGSLTLSGVLTLTQDVYYSNLTLTAGAVINPAGYRIFCKVLDLTNAPAGAIVRSGGNGNNSSTTAGGTVVTGPTAVTLGGGANGIAGAAGSAAAGTASGGPGSSTPGNGGNGGNSGASGAGSGGAGVATGGGGAASNTINFGRYETDFFRIAAQVQGGAGGDGGNSGGGDGAASPGGGSAGAGGGVLGIWAEEIITGPSTPAGVIVSKGGAGGKQNNAATGNKGGAGGAGGGGGGYVYICYAKKTGSAVSGLINCDGGNGGDGSDGAGTGIGGNGGQGGDGGRIQLINLRDGTGSLTVGSVGTSGTAAVGTTKGLGGTFGTCSAAL